MNPQHSRKHSSGARQWHLDLIMLGGLTAAAPRFVPDVPRKVGVPLAVGAWVDANAFGALAFRPGLKDRPVPKASVAWRRWLNR